MPESEIISVCPECDHPGVRHRATREPGYNCKRCGATFDEPAQRKAKDSPLGTPETEDGLPKGLAPEAKERIRELREGLDA
jgi:hypothetical protein